MYNIAEVRTMRDIGKNIKDLRSQKNLTQDELAEKLFVTRQTVSNYETGRSRPDVEMLAKIADVLDTDANTVIYGMSEDIGRKKKYTATAIGAAMILLLILPIPWLNSITDRIGGSGLFSGPDIFSLYTIFPLSFCASAGKPWRFYLFLQN